MRSRRIAAAAALALASVAAGAAAPAARVDRDVEVPMRDGVVLRADLYRPAQ